MSFRQNEHTECLEENKVQTKPISKYEQNILKSLKKSTQFFDISNIQPNAKKQNIVKVADFIQIQQQQTKQSMKKKDPLTKLSSLKKIKRIQSYNLKQSSIQSSCGTVRKVKFEEESNHQSKIDSSTLSQTQAQRSKLQLINKYYNKKVFVKNNKKIGQKNKQSFMQFICGLIQLRPTFRMSKKTNVEKQLLLLWQINITGHKNQWEMLKSIYLNLTHQQIGQNNHKWPTIGFNSQEPMKELNEYNILTLLQWYNFTHSHTEFAQKILNFCIQINCPVFIFHSKATQYFCEQLEICEIAAKSWEEFQKWYNIAVKVAYYELLQISKVNVNLVRQEMVIVFKKCSRSIKQQFKEETKQKIEKK